MSIESTTEILRKAGYEIQSQEGVEIFLALEDKEPGGGEEKNNPALLNGIYQKLAFAYLTSEASNCPSFNKVLCGKTGNTLPENLECMFSEEVAAKKETLCTLALGEFEGEELKTATLILSRDEESLMFNVMSENSSELSFRRIYLTVFKKDGTQPVTLQSFEEGDNVWESYTSAVKLLEEVNDWQKPDSCRNCPLVVLPEKEFA